MDFQRESVVPTAFGQSLGGDQIRPERSSISLVVRVHFRRRIFGEVFGVAVRRVRRVGRFRRFGVE